MNTACSLLPLCLWTSCLPCIECPPRLPPFFAWSFSAHFQNSDQMSFFWYALPAFGPFCLFKPCSLFSLAFSTTSYKSSSPVVLKVGYGKNRIPSSMFCMLCNVPNILIQWYTCTSWLTNIPILWLCVQKLFYWLGLIIWKVWRSLL